MFGLGLWEILIIAVVAILLIRPQDLPKVLRRLGRAYGALARLKESALDRARELESEINRAERAPAAPTPGTSAAATAEDRGLAEETEELYRRLQQERGEQSASLRMNDGRDRTGARRKRAVTRTPENQGGTGKP
ncbi:MAG: twin-arginine translocase TatA/TatE family subunit [Spirochaetales bacterium]|nr:twin-arginine translocase TatA/TatE family subunit [Spirochaetales bacterium]